jgi:hypothetical protein
MIVSRPSACLDALRAFAAKRFADWRGLPAPCSVEDALGVFAPQSEWVGAAALGSDSVPASYRYCTAPSYATPVRLWFADSEIRLLDAEGPLDGLPFAALAAPLGEPEAKLDTWFGFARVAAGEWVYAARGIAFAGDSSCRQIHRLWVFAPTTVEHYLQTLRVDLRQRPLPEARWN